MTWFLHNRSEEGQVKQFLALLKAGDYKGAYALWGCTDTQPCRDYPMKAFMEDWGPQTVPPDNFRVLDGDSCGSGVIVDADLGKAGDKRLWVGEKHPGTRFPTLPSLPAAKPDCRFLPESQIPDARAHLSVNLEKPIFSGPGRV